MLIGCLRPGPETDEVVVRKAEHRPQHSGSEIDVLRGVVDDPQQGGGAAEAKRESIEERTGKSIS